jgi:hypothetical protein
VCEVGSVETDRCERRIMMKWDVKLMAYCEKWVTVEANNEAEAKKVAIYGDSIQETNWEFVDEMEAIEVEEAE